MVSGFGRLLWVGVDGGLSGPFQIPFVTSCVELFRVWDFYIEFCGFYDDEDQHDQVVTRALKLRDF